MSGAYRLSPDADSDLEEIVYYIALGSRQAAHRLIDLFFEKFQILADNPKIGRSREELLPDLRSFPVKSYVVFYWEKPSHGIEILRILHGARDIDQLFHR